MAFQLIITSVSGQQKYSLPEGDFEWLLGRLATANVVLADSGVSRNHARLSRENGRLFIADLKSAAGTQINGLLLEGKRAFDLSDEVSIAIFSLNLLQEEKKEPPPMSAPPSSPSPPLLQKNPSGEAPMANNFLDEFKDATVLCTPDVMDIRQRLLGLVRKKVEDSEPKYEKGTREWRKNLGVCVDRTMREQQHELPRHITHDVLRQALLDEIDGFGPITSIIRSPRVSEIMINGPEHIFVESSGKIYETGVRFFDEAHLRNVISTIVEPVGRRIDDSSPMVDARLPDGSRVNAVVPPLALDGSSMTIRKFSDKKLTTDDLVKFGSMTQEMALFLEEAVRSQQNIVVSGGTGSGKTTLLNVLSQFIPSGERIVTVEDSAELKLSHRNIVRLEARPANIEGKGRISIRDLVINTLRMRPDRIIVGECRGAEAMDMLQAMNTGHDGSLTTCHANNPREALGRLENMVMMAGFDLPSSAIREQIAAAVDIIVQQTRLPDGSRKVIDISEVTGREGTTIQLQPIFEFKQEGFDAKGKVIGKHVATGNIPYFIADLKRSGSLRLDMDVFVPKT